MRARSALASLLLAGALPAAATKIPQPVSPGALSTVALTEARCPTFSWSGVPGARGYELAVFRVADPPGAEPILVTRASVPGDARAFTPQVGQCLERGERYAWSVAATHDEDELAWAPTLLFQVEAGPSPEELEQAVATLERHLDRVRADDTVRDRDELPHAALLGLDDASTGNEAPRATEARTSRVPSTRRLDTSLPGALTTPTSAIRTSSADSTPTLGNASLTVTNQIHLAAASTLFKEDSVFLWDDDDGNIALGRKALSSVTTATRNTALGREALQNATGGSGVDGSANTAVGERALRNNSIGFSNTAGGVSALYDNTSGYQNTAHGVSALHHNSTGHRNTATGAGALYENSIGTRNTANGTFALSGTTGDRNTALGNSAGSNNIGGDDSIFINNLGLPGDSGTIKIGTQGTQTSTFIAGIRGVTTTAVDAITVLISSTGQLGTVSSSRAVKQDVQDLGFLADRLLELRPVAFRYRQHAEADPETPLQFGLIAEEVAEVFPELVVYDDEGKPETVKYHLLSSLLLGELQRVRSEHEAELQRLGARLAALESRSSPTSPATRR